MDRHQTKELTVNDPEFWDQLYRAGNTPWDLGKPAPPLETFSQSPYMVPNGRMLVLGCGSGHECLLFAKRGLEVTGVDFSETAVQATLQKFLAAGVSGTTGFLLQRDLFDIHAYDHYYDYVLEHCCFSALDPARRRTYFWTVRDLLKPGGRFVALWWFVDRPGGPPFSFSKDELYKLCDPVFKIDLAYEPQNSVPERKGCELLTVMTAK